MSIRNERIAEQVRQEIARLLREEVSDPRIGMLTLTRVKVSPDLSTAVLLWSPLDLSGETDLDEMSAGLDSASGYLRRQLAHNLSLRRTPELKFEHDRSIEVGSRTLALLRSLDDTGPRNVDGPDGPDGPDEADQEESDDGETA